MQKDSLSTTDPVLPVIEQEQQSFSSSHQPVMSDINTVTDDETPNEDERRKKAREEVLFKINEEETRLQAALLKLQDIKKTL